MDHRNEQRNESSRIPEESHKQRQDFDDSANDLWSLYGKEAKSHDEARINTLKVIRMGSLSLYVQVFSCQPRLTSLSIQAGLFSGVLTAFVVPRIQDLKVNLADQSVYYQNQSAQMLNQISQQFTSLGNQISTNFTPHRLTRAFICRHPTAE
jgi:Family of unknown function (DUF6535)